ncbi:hypothetical protein CCAX7_65470 [Capsulimonas corticalis]|uniref:Uncharacterized protein n=1 Tax=Capsulimonas corticalis TaxID=2219043 RepID=A0A402CQT7_9BACT|nr:TonB-dependent receptor [Capsulimonas corticalis]BDI34496.1 hypothetical protein CCAX7_65470 [Capsulimonas corticalis]
MRRIHARRWAVAATLLAALPCPAPCATPAGADAASPGDEIFDPKRAPVIVVKVTAKKHAAVPKQSGSTTTITAQSIENKANSSSFSSIIASSVAGAVQSSSGDLHIRGSHGQYTYYLDGAPLPSSVSGSFTDLIDPKNIETLKVYTGGFPSYYGGNLAAVFAVNAKAGRPGHPTGLFQQIVQGYETYETIGQTSGGVGRVSYFLSGIRGSTDRRLDPVSQTPLHDSGSDSVVFGKFDYQAGRNDKLTIDTAHTDSELQIPNEPDRQAIGQDDRQVENGTFANVIWKHDDARQSLLAAFYSHTSQLRYNGDPVHDLMASADNPDTSGLVSTFENQKANYAGVRTDYSVRVARRHTLGVGFDGQTVTGSEQFKILSGNGDAPVTDNHNIGGNDQSAYLQDDWTPGRWQINFGARYDVHKAVIESSQLSPRLNMTYAAGPHDHFHAYYDRLFQPTAFEDVRQLSGSTAIGNTVVTSIKPERDDFYEVGYQHDHSGVTTTLSAYYKTAKDVVDDTALGSTQITVPFNVEKGYVRGLEAAVDGPITHDLSGYANYARSWAKNAGAITGGIFSSDISPGYFYADHDQTDTAAVGLSYSHGSIGVNLDGEYGSGLPYGQDDAGNVNFLRVPSHFIFNGGLSVKSGHSEIEATVINLLNQPYVIKQASAFSGREWGQGRTFGVKFTQTF